MYLVTKTLPDDQDMTQGSTAGLTRLSYNLTMEFWVPIFLLFLGAVEYADWIRCTPQMSWIWH